MVCSVTPSYSKVFKYNKNPSVIMILKSAAASQSALRWSCQPLQRLGRLNEMPHVENKNDFSAFPRAAPLALQELFSQPGLGVLRVGNFQHCCFPAWKISHGVRELLRLESIKVLFALVPHFSWSNGSVCAIPAWPQQHGVENRIIPKLPVLAALILLLGLGK